MSLLERLIADDEAIAEDFGIRARPLTEKQFLRLPKATTQAFWIASRLYRSHFLRCDSYEEFVAMMDLIQEELDD